MALHRFRRLSGGPTHVPELGRYVVEGDVVEIREDCGFGPPEWEALGPAEGQSSTEVREAHRRGRRASEE